jgi:hypothetical protein
MSAPRPPKRRRVHEIAVQLPAANRVIVESSSSQDRRPVTTYRSVEPVASSFQSRQARSAADSWDFDHEGSNGEGYGHVPDDDEEDEDASHISQAALDRAVGAVSDASDGSDGESDDDGETGDGLVDGWQALPVMPVPSDEEQLADAAEHLRRHQALEAFEKRTRPLGTDFKATRPSVRPKRPEGETVRWPPRSLAGAG